MPASSRAAFFTHLKEIAQAEYEQYVVELQEPPSIACPGLAGAGKFEPRATLPGTGYRGHQHPYPASKGRGE